MVSIKWVKNVSLPVLLMLLIFVESSIPTGSESGSGNVDFLVNLKPEIQNFLHVPLYGLLAFLWQRSFHAMKMQSSFAWTAALTITVVYGCLDEIHQAFVPGRCAGMLDIGLNLIGAVLGSLVYMMKSRSAAGEVG